MGALWAVQGKCPGDTGGSGGRQGEAQWEMPAGIHENGDGEDADRIPRGSVPGAWRGISSGWLHSGSQTWGSELWDG